jgi:hypothetical protein
MANVIIRKRKRKKRDAEINPGLDYLTILSGQKGTEKKIKDKLGKNKNKAEKVYKSIEKAVLKAKGVENAY